MYQFDQKDYCHEPMFTIFTKHDKDKDGFLKQGEVKAALSEAGVQVMDEELAFDWLDKDFDNALSYKEFRRAAEKATNDCPDCHYARHPDSSDSECEQEDLLRTYWRKFDPERRGWVHANKVIDYLAQDWGITVPQTQRLEEARLMEADDDGKINYRKFKKYFTSVPEDDLKQRVSSVGCNSNFSLKQFEKHLDEMLLAN